MIRAASTITAATATALVLSPVFGLAAAEAAPANARADVEGFQVAGASTFIAPATVNDESVWSDRAPSPQASTVPAAGTTGPLIIGGTCLPKVTPAILPTAPTIPADDPADCLDFRAVPVDGGIELQVDDDAAQNAPGAWLARTDSGVLDLGTERSTFSAVASVAAPVVTTLFMRTASGPIEGTSTPGTTVSVFDAETGEEFCADVPTDTDGNWSCSLDHRLEIRPYDIAVVARATDGVLSPITNATVLVPLVDAPSVPIVDAGPLAPGSTVIEGTGDPDSLVEIFTADGETLCLSEPADADGRWSCEFAEPLSPGEHALSAEARFHESAPSGRTAFTLIVADEATDPGEVVVPGDGGGGDTGTGGDAGGSAGSGAGGSAGDSTNPVEADKAAAKKPGALAYTGASIAGALGLAGLLSAAGIALSVLRKRRRV